MQQHSIRQIHRPLLLSRPLQSCAIPRLMSRDSRRRRESGVGYDRLQIDNRSSVGRHLAVSESVMTSDDSRRRRGERRKQTHSTIDGHVLVQAISRTDTMDRRILASSHLCLSQRTTDTKLFFSLRHTVRVWRGGAIDRALDS